MYENYSQMIHLSLTQFECLANGIVEHLKTDITWYDLDPSLNSGCPLDVSQELKQIFIAETLPFLQTDTKSSSQSFISTQGQNSELVE